MKTPKCREPVGRIKIRIPHLFEAEGEGGASVAGVVVLSLIFLALCCWLGGHFSLGFLRTR